MASHSLKHLGSDPHLRLAQYMPLGGPSSRLLHKGGSERSFTGDGASASHFFPSSFAALLGPWHSRNPGFPRKNPSVKVPANDATGRDALIQRAFRVLLPRRSLKAPLALLQRVSVHTRRIYYLND